MRRKIAILVVAASMGWCGHVSADDVLLGQIYGNGVHAFNQGDYVSAYNALTSAIKGGTRDPRAYYFRGLAFLRLGREQEAVSDFEKGAALEVGDSANAFPVNRSLERIQGQPRQVLEYYRMTVHAAAVEKQEAARQARYEERAAAEQNVLRRVQPAQLAPSTAADSHLAVPPQPETKPEGNPFDVTPQTPAPKPVPMEEKKPAPGNEPSPFDTTPTTTPKAAPANEGSPFDTPPAAAPGTAMPPATAPKAAPAADAGPFGSAPSAAPSTPAAADSSPVHPTQGGIGSLVRAMTVGMHADSPPPAAGGADMSAGMMDMMKGLMGGPPGQPPAGAMPPNGAGAPPANAGGPQPAMPAGAVPAAGPTTDDLFGPPATTPAPAPATTPAPAVAPAGAPAAAPPPATTPPVPKSGDDPFN